MKGKALRKHSLHEKTAASVSLKLFYIYVYVNCFQIIKKAKTKRTCGILVFLSVLPYIPTELPRL